MALSSDSDVMEALTTYINDNAEARAWLNGKPDPWGMVVNPAYKGIKLPVDQWPLLSTFEPKAYYASDNNDCLYNSPVPYLPLVAAPLATLEDISEAMQFDDRKLDDRSAHRSTGRAWGRSWFALGRQTVGYRFMIGITPLADDQRYELQAASLQTSGNSFVAPNNASLRAATDLLKPDEQTGTWPLPYAEWPRVRLMPRPIRAPWSFMPRCRRPGFPRSRRPIMPPCCSSPLTTGQEARFRRRTTSARLPPYDKGRGLGRLGRLHDGRGRTTSRHKKASCRR